MLQQWGSRRVCVCEHTEVSISSKLPEWTQQRLHYREKQCRRGEITKVDMERKGDRMDIYNCINYKSPFYQDISLKGGGRPATHTVGPW